MFTILLTYCTLLTFIGFYLVYYFVFLLSTTSDDFNGYPGGDPYRENAPQPPGFRSEFSNFTPNAGSPYGASCGEGQAGFGSRPESSRTSTGAGGFWTGAAAGGLLGYMFGNRGYRMIFLLSSA